MSDNSGVHFGGSFHEIPIQESVLQASVTDKVEENEPEASQNGLPSTATIQEINPQARLNGLPSLDQVQEN